MVTKAARDPSQPSQEELDHTAKMNQWFVESFQNLFAAKLVMIAEATGDNAAKMANEILRQVYTDINAVRKDMLVMKILMLSSDDVKPSDVVAKFREMEAAIIKSSEYPIPSYEIRDPELAEQTKAKLKTIKPTQFTFELRSEPAPASPEANSLEAARERNRRGWRTLMKNWFNIQ